MLLDRYSTHLMSGISQKESGSVFQMWVRVDIIFTVATKNKFSVILSNMWLCPMYWQDSFLEIEHKHTLCSKYAHVVYFTVVYFQDNQIISLTNGTGMDYEMLLT